MLAYGVSVELKVRCPYTAAKCTLTSDSSYTIVKIHISSGSPFLKLPVASVNLNKRDLHSLSME